MHYKQYLKEFAIITFGTLIATAAIYFFMLPSHIAVGSGAALALILSNYIPLSVSALTMILNVVLLILGFLLIGPEFGIKTVYCAILLPSLLAVLSGFSLIFSPSPRIRCWM